MHAGYSQWAEVCGICMPLALKLLFAATVAILNIQTD